jgi:hypothetical protein
VRAARALVAITSAVAMAGACSSQPSLPPTLGDCTPTADASCTTVTGGGSPSGPGHDSGGTDGGGGGGSTCGAAPAALGATATNCVPCVDGTDGTGNLGCCQVALSCTGGCIPLLSCMLQCRQGDTACQNGCIGRWPDSVTAYNDFASCVTTSCSTCPSPPPASGNADF